MWFVAYACRKELVIDSSLIFNFYSGFVGCFCLLPRVLHMLCLPQELLRGAEERRAGERGERSEAVRGFSSYMVRGLGCVVVFCARGSVVDLQKCAIRGSTIITGSPWAIWTHGTSIMHTITSC